MKKYPWLNVPEKGKVGGRRINCEHRMEEGRNESKQFLLILYLFPFTTAIREPHTHKCKKQKTARGKKGGETKKKWFC